MTRPCCLSKCHNHRALMGCSVQGCCKNPPFLHFIQRNTGGGGGGGVANGRGEIPTETTELDKTVFFFLFYVEHVNSVV